MSDFHIGNQITASGETIMRQAWMTADEFLMHAITCIDECLVAENVRSDHPLMDESLEGITTALETISKNLNSVVGVGSWGGGDNTSFIRTLNMGD